MKNDVKSHELPELMVFKTELLGEVSAIVETSLGTAEGFALAIGVLEY